MLKRIYQLFALAVLLSVLAGCGTLFGRNGSYYGPDYYTGTAYDFGVLFGSDEVNRGYFPATAWCWLSVVCPVLTVFSLPVDAAVDTVMLPHDIYRVNKRLE